MIITADKRGRTDSVFHTLLPRINSEYPLVIVSWVEGFEFNEELLKLKDYVLIDFREFGWNYTITNSHIFGTENGLNGQYSGKQWERFNVWVANNPYKILFQRELLEKDVTDTIRPIEYPCLTSLYPTDTKERFDNRPISAFQYWGRSSEHRLRIHGEIWLHGYKKGFQPCDNVYYFNHYMHREQGEKWVTLWIPHYQRVDIKELLKINNCSKLSLSWHGSGLKCFRTAEAPVNSVMVMEKNDYAWTFAWDETNCILVDKYDEINGIEKALQRPDLYEIYCNGVENAARYHIDEYSKYISTIINNA
jgi:hypothetical protein